MTILAKYINETKNIKNEESDNKKIVRFLTIRFLIIVFLTNDIQNEGRHKPACPLVYILLGARKKFRFKVSIGRKVF